MFLINIQTPIGTSLAATWIPITRWVEKEISHLPDLKNAMQPTRAGR